MSAKKTSNIPIRYLPTLRTSITFIWLENTAESSKEIYETVDQLCTSKYCHIFRYRGVAQCLKYLKQAKSYERIVLIIDINNVTDTTVDVSQFCQYRQLRSIFVVSSDVGNNESHNKIYNETRGIVEVFHDYHLLLRRLEQLVNEIDELDDDFFIFADHSEKAFRHLGDELASYIWSQSIRVVLKAMPYKSAEAKREMLIECRACCCYDQQTLRQINEFERTYCSVDAVRWYTKPCFLYRLINRALRTEDNFVVYKFRYFIMDLCARLEETALTSHDHPVLFRVYRGSKLSRNEVEKLQVSALVATNGFFSSSKDLRVAQRFAGIDPDTGNSPSRSPEEQCQYIIFEVDIDLVNAPNVVVADISRSTVISDENEMLFKLGTTFKITDINYDKQHHSWHIRMVTSSELALIDEKYQRYIYNRCIETTPATSFGHLTCEIFSNYPVALKYLQRLLHSKAWNDDDRLEIYHYLGRVYYFMGKYEQAIACFHCTQLLVRRRLSEFSHVYVRSIHNLSVTYLELGDFAHAVHFQERALEICRKTLPKNHYEFGFHLNHSAHIYWRKGQYEDALNVLTNTIPLIKEEFPPNYPCHAQALYIKGLVYHSLNKHEQSINYFKESFQMRQRFQATDHPYIGKTYYKLSILYTELNDFSTALDYAQKSLAIRKAKLPRSHRELQQSIELVEHLLQQGNTIPALQ